MRPTTPERRRTTRTVITDAEFSVLAFPVPVRLIDVSLSGVLFESTHAVEPGTRGTVRFNFGGVPFSAEVEVQRLTGLSFPPARLRFAVGATFVALSGKDQRVIERFADQ